jgi:hypothetical protein
MGFEELKLVLFESLFLGLHILFYKKTWSDHLLEHSEAMNEPKKKNVQMTLKDHSFVNKFKVLFVCIPERRVTFKFLEMLEMPQRVTLVPEKYIYFFFKF